MKKVQLILNKACFGLSIHQIIQKRKQHKTDNKKCLLSTKSKY